MTRVHVIDDNVVIRDNLRDALMERLPAELDGIATECWESAKEAVEAIRSRRPRAPREGEVAICDLFDVDHYAVRESFAVPRIRSRRDDPENVKRASLDNVERFFPPLLHHGVRIVVFSFVFALLEEKHDPEGAEQVTQALLRAGVPGENIHRKPQREVSLDDLQPVANHVAELIGRR